MAIEIKTKFGNLYYEEMPMNEQALIDSKGIIIWCYDNDMVKNHIKDLESAETEQEFFDLLNTLIDDNGIYWGKNKKKVADELYSEIKDYEERNGRNIKERTTKKLVLDTISECANRIGKYYALCDYWDYF